MYRLKTAVVNGGWYRIAESSDEVAICAKAQGSSSSSNPLRATARFSPSHGPVEAHEGVPAVSGHTTAVRMVQGPPSPSRWTGSTNGLPTGVSKRSTRKTPHGCHWSSAGEEGGSPQPLHSGLGPNAGRQIFSDQMYN
ncbi:hypothetical protein ZHAS_00019869 [Anopheles sinensis]|uniref:Uncharacterized protein n=1 Tax=Anopheles sinensis TaxID=74873 RepID=A0A084WNH9_ANOSI|nr:hypothetical protein ZHAS_00019869 [Anopheles sinensis]